MHQFLRIFYFETEIFISKILKKKKNYNLYRHCYIIKSMKM